MSDPRTNGWPDELTRDDLLPPHDLDAEQAMLGACLLGNPNDLDAVLVVTSPDDCYHDAHGTILRAAADLRAASRPVDTVTVASHLRAAGTLEAVGGMDYLDRLERSVPFGDHAAAYAQRVAECAMRRQVAAAAQRIRQECYSDRSLAEVCASARALTERLEPPTMSATVREGAALWAQWQRGIDGAIPPISTGFPTLDDAMLGGWHLPRLHLLTAYSGMGKSSFLACILHAAMKAGRCVGLLSLEMDAAECCARLLALESDVPYRWLEVGWPPEHAVFGDGSNIREGAAAGMARLASMPLVIDDAQGYSPAEMLARLRHLRLRYGCELLCIDHVGLIYSPDLPPEEYPQLLAVNSALRRARAELNCPILAVQQQRMDKDGRATMATIKGCRQLAEDAAVLLVLNSRFDGDEPEATLAVEKSRGGQKCVGRRAIQLIGDRATFAWRERGKEPVTYDDPYA